MHACCYVNDGGHSFRVECGNTQKSAHPLFGEHVRCTAHGFPLRDYGKCISLSL